VCLFLLVILYSNVIVLISTCLFHGLNLLMILSAAKVEIFRLLLMLFLVVWLRVEDKVLPPRLLDKKIKELVFNAFISP
jgi:hypothetical protein